jgi:hypothetical protein
MNLRNTSPYHTPTLRKLFALTFRAIKVDSNGDPDKGFRPRILVEEGRTRVRWEWDENAKVPTLHVKLPKLTGDEFIALFRQQHGGAVQRYSNPADPKFGQTIQTHGALTSERVALEAQQALYALLNIAPKAISGVPDISVRVALKKAKVPEFVPLRVRKPVREKEPRNIVDERYQRVLELEAKWMKKIKLAQTKLKKLRVKRRHYEKKFSKEQA